MTHKKQDLEAIIDDGARAIRDEQIDPSIVSESSARVWARVQRQMEGADASIATGITATAKNDERHTAINGCADYQALIPAFVGGELSAARTLLVEDHTRECVACRQALKAAKNNSATVSATAVNAAATYVPRSHAKSANTRQSKFASFGVFKKIGSPARIGAALALVVCCGFAALFVADRFDWSGRTLAATIETTEGAVYIVSDANGGENRSLAAGEQLQKGELVRTAKDSNAVLRLADGSTVEMRERTEFSVSENRRGVTVKLGRGDVIVEAAKQHNGRLYVQTPDSLVSVKGTIFAVESGTKGSRVSVVEGEVAVNHHGKDETLLPGDQTTTNSSLAKTPVAENVAWSRNAARYANLAAELAKLRREVNTRAARPGVRYESKLVDLVPADTVFYAALPNLTETLAESQRIMQERIAQNPALAEWWKGKRGTNAGSNEEMLTRVREFGARLGDEIVVSAKMDAKGEPNGVLVLSQVKNAADFRPYLNEQIARLANESNGRFNVRIVEDPLTEKIVSAPAGKDDSAAPNAKKPEAKSELFVWVRDDIFAASPRVESLRELAATLNAPAADRFANSSFHQRIKDVYKDGAGLLVAADLEKIVTDAAAKDNAPDAEKRREGLRQLGVMNLRHFVVEQKETDGKTLSRAALTFSEPNRGIASWLAAPASMGGLEFISPNANVATAFVVKKPELMVDDLFGFLETIDPDLRRRVADIEKQQGIDIRNDFAAPLGGEFAFAIDGPVFPTPSWKIVLEVYDQAKLQGTFERSIEKLNQFAVIHGKGKLSITGDTADGRTFYTIRSADANLEVHYVYANGYLVAAPSRALLEQSLKNREAGITLVRSPRFLSALPQDGNANFSAVFYHDLAPLVAPLVEKMKNAGGENMTEEQRRSIQSIDVNAPPTLAYAYAGGDRITIAANTEGGAFGLNPSTLVGLPNSFEMQSILTNALGDKKSEKAK